MPRLPKDKTRCRTCRTPIPKKGVGRLSHLRKHVREGTLVEVHDSTGIEFLAADDTLGIATASMRGRLAAAAASVRA